MSRARLTARRLGLLGCLLGCGTGAGSSSADAGGSRARVTLEVDAEPAVALKTAAVRVRLVPLPDLPMPGAMLPALDTPRRSLTYDVFSWPIRLELPDDMLEQAPAFWAEAAALDVNGRELTASRLITSQLPGRLLAPKLVLSARCLDVICGSRMSTCSDSGFCGSSIRDPLGLPNAPLE